MATASTAAAAARPVRVADELRWELVRDEWELLLAIGSGPTSVADLCQRLSEPTDAVAARVRVLVDHQLVQPVGDGYGLVPVFHQRQEGMASYLRDMVIKRLQPAGPPPIAGALRDGLGGPEAVRTLIAAADESLFPPVVAAASRPESDRSERFTVYFAVASDCPPAGPTSDTLQAGLMRVLRAAAVQRSHPQLAPGAKLWIAEMRTDPEVADEIGGLFQSFMQAAPAGSGAGAAVFAILPTPSGAAVKPR